MARQKQKWRSGDVFTIPLEDKTFALGQVVGAEFHAMNSVICAFYAIRCNEAETPKLDELSPRTCIALLFTTRDLLDRGVWNVIGNRTPPSPEPTLRLRELRDVGFVGAKIHGSGIITDFIRAFYGLTPWDAYADPTYLDSLLISADKKPSDVWLVSDFDQPLN